MPLIGSIRIWIARRWQSSRAHVRVQSPESTTQEELNRELVQSFKLGFVTNYLTAVFVSFHPKLDAQGAKPVDLI